MRRSPSLLILAALLCGVVAACRGVGPNFVPPSEPVPDHYAGAQGAVPAIPESQPPAFWWREFHDAELDRLEERAAAGNLDLKSAYLRMVEARLQVQAARAQGLPTLNGMAAYTREQLGIAGLLESQNLGGGLTSTPTAQQFIGQLEKPVNLYQLGFDASWELDLFGRVRRSVEAAEAQSAGAMESRNDLLVSLAAEVAQTYFQLRAAQTLRGIDENLIADQREVYTLTLNKEQHGLAGDTDVQSARAQLASLESQLPQYEQTISSSRHALAVLLGQPPAALDEEIAMGELPPMPAAVPVGVPAMLVRRRPDIRNAEDQLHAATAEVGVSVASLFPDVTLAGTFGLRNTSTQYLFDWASHFYTFGPTVSVPIFRGGSLIANVRLSRARTAEAAFNYRKAVLAALQEVEDGLTSLQQDARRIAALTDAEGADQRALDVDRDAYRHGIVTYLTVLTVQLQAVQARQQLAQALSAQITDLVKLYKALGGGWEGAPGLVSTNGTVSGDPSQPNSTR
jgi:NodT family efflux transporter outer membrane factor (OMF) lipoprotein